MKFYDLTKQEKKSFEAKFNPFRATFIPPAWQEVTEIETFPINFYDLQKLHLIRLIETDIFEANEMNRTGNVISNLIALYANDYIINTLKFDIYEKNDISNKRHEVVHLRHTGEKDMKNKDVYETNYTPHRWQIIFMNNYIL